MPGTPLEELDTESVSNVYIFLADALRYDSLPEEVSERGASFKTVAHALATPQCLPTIVPGRLPPRHGVEWFIHTMPSDLPTVFDIEGHNTGYSELLWPGSALQDVLRNPEDVDIESVEEPFVVFEHDNGGHAPYPETDAENPEDMLRGMDPKTDIRERYRKTVSWSATRFSERLGILDDRGLLNDTLVIFMADHGQLLGEHGGFFGHGLPMTPEVAYVPMTFIHPCCHPGNEGATCSIRSTCTRRSSGPLLAKRQNLTGIASWRRSRRIGPHIHRVLCSLQTSTAIRSLIQHTMREVFGHHRAATFSYRIQSSSAVLRQSTKGYYQETRHRLITIRM